MNHKEVPTPTLERLSTYLRALDSMQAHEIEMICSAEMERDTGISAAQFRKDLSYFGEFGKPGIGYSVRDLHKSLQRILKLDKEQSVVMVGAGNLGSALVAFPAWKQYKFSIVAVFDNNPNKIGEKLWNLHVQPIEEFTKLNKDLNAQIAIIAVPDTEAQNVANMLIAGGVKVILNFAPTNLRAPQGIVIRNVCFIQELAVLSYFLDQG